MGLYGWGPRPDWLTASVDNFWLLTAVRYGLPALLFLISAIVVIAVRQARNVSRDKELNLYRMGWLATIIGLSVSGITVHFWNAMFAYFFFLVGTGVWMTTPVKSTAKALRRAQYAVLLQRMAAIRPS